MIRDYQRSACYAWEDRHIHPNDTGTVPFEHSILGRGGIRDDRARATLAIFYAKTRMGWKETSIHRHGEAPPEDPDAALEAITRGLDRLAARKGKMPPAASPNGSAARAEFARHAPVNGIPAQSTIFSPASLTANPECAVRDFRAQS